MPSDFIGELIKKKYSLDQERPFSQFQALSDLGYLPAELVTENDDRGLKESAVRTFRKEYTESGFSPSRVNYEHPDDYTIYASLLNASEEELLHRMLSVNGGFVFSEFPVIQKKLLWRIAVFRISLFGYHANDLHIAVNKIGAFIGENNPLNVLNLIGMLEVLLFRYTEICSDHTSWKIARVYPGDESFSSRDETFFDNGRNEFVARLFQLFMWKHGYYSGKIDGDLGNMSKDSLNELLRDINKQLDTHYSIDTFAIKDPGLNYQMWNIGDLVHLSQKRTAHLIGDLDFSEENEFIGNDDDYPRDIAVGAMNITLSGDVAAGRRSNFDSYFALTKDKWQKIDNEIFAPLMRRNYSVKQKRKKLQLLFRKKPVLRNFFRILVRKLRQTISVLIHGFRFLSGQRSLETNSDQGVIFTNFDFDFDVITCSPENVPRKVLNRHCRKVRYYSDSLNQSLALAGKVVSIVYSLSTPLSWRKLLFKSGLL